MLTLPRRHRHVALFALLPLGVLLLTGCSTVTASRSTLMDVLGGEAGQPAAAVVPKCSIIIRAENTKPQTIQMPITGPLHVQDALDFAKAGKRFRRMNVHVLRHVAPNGDSAGGMVKINVRFDRGEKRVSVDTDCQLREGDRVVVVEDSTTALDDAIQKFTGPVFGSRGGR